MFHCWSLYILILFAASLHIDGSIFEGSQEDVFAFKKLKDSFPGILVGSADLNNDRKNDFFILDGTKLNVVYRTAKGYDKVKLLDLGSKKVKSVVSSDFNGDSLLDLLVVYTADSKYKASVYFGSVDGSTTKFDKAVDLSDSFTKQPLLFQYDVDMLTDILIEVSEKKLSVVKFDPESKEAKSEVVSESFPALATPAYSAFVDVTGDLQADVLLSVTKDNKQRFVFVASNDGKFDFSKPELLKELPNSYELIGQPLFQDWDFDGRLEMLLPVCVDKACATSEVYIYDFVTKKWDKVDVDLKEYRFLPATENKLNDDVELSQLSVISSADINLDQYPDCLLIMKNSKTSATSPAVLLNQGKRKFKLQIIETKESDLQIAAFVDFGELGVFDMATVSKSKAADSATTLLHRQETIGDAYFLKVMILSGVCGEMSQCKSARLPIGVPTPGPAMRYTTEGSTGLQVSSCAAQVSHTSYMALGLPFYVFGLGPFANYLEKLFVSLPRKTKSREHEFNFIVPKTELTIIPYPLDSPSKWKSKLFIDPFTDKKVIYVAIALCGVCLLVLIIIIILQYLEVKADKTEKMQEAQKFNFDAM